MIQKLALPIAIAGLAVSIGSAGLSTWASFRVSEEASLSAFHSEKLKRIADLKKAILAIAETETRCLRAWPMDGSWDANCPGGEIDYLKPAIKMDRLLLSDLAYFSLEARKKLHWDTGKRKAFKWNEDYPHELDAVEYAGWMETVFEILDMEEQSSLNTIR